MEFFEQFIRPESFIMIPVLYLIALMMKQTPRFPVWLIGWSLMAIGIVFCCFYYGWEVTSVVQGILVAGAAVLVRDLIHDTTDAVVEVQENKNGNGNGK